MTNYIIFPKEKPFKALTVYIEDVEFLGRPPPTNVLGTFQK